MPISHSEQQSTLLQPHPLPVRASEPQSLSELAKMYFNHPEQGVVRSETDESPSEFLSRFGLKTSESLDKFLKTPAGQEVITEIAEELAIEKSFAEHRQQEERKHELLIRRIKIALFLWFLEKKAHASDKIKELIRNQIEKALGHKETPKDTSIEKDLYAVDLGLLVNHYNKSIQSAEIQQTQLKEEELQLLTELAALEEQNDALLAKYNLYEQHVLDDHFEAFIDKDNHINPEEIEKAHKALVVDMESLYEHINQIIEKEGDPTPLIQQQTALNLKFAALDDMLAVHRGEKFYADTEGNNVSNPKNAVFILSKTDRLIYENGQYYLLKPTQNWDSLKDNPEERTKALQQAKDNFDRSKAEIMTVKKAINHNRQMEETVHHDKVQDKRFAINLNHAEQQLLANQIRLLESARSEMQTALTLTLRPSVKPTVTTHSNTPRPSLQPALIYKEALEKLKQAARITQDDLLNLANQAPGATNQLNARLYIQNLFASGGAKLAALPAQYKEQLFKRMLEFGVDNPLTHQQMERAPYKSPSPFNTTPSPFKK